MKRKFVIISLAAAIAMGLPGCGTDGENASTEAAQEQTSKETENETPGTEAEEPAEETETEEQSEEETETEEVTEEAQEEIPAIQVGETVTTENFEFTLNKVELSYDILPDDTSGFYTHYPAESGQVYIHLDADIKNTQKQNLYCDEIYEVVADYNNGYTYNGHPIVDDATTGFTYANITGIDPLQTLGVHYLIECPEEVETSQNPLFITITMNDDSEYRYVIR